MSKIKGAALITGASGRLGRAMAVDLAGLGHDIVIHHRSSAADAEETAAAVREQGARAAILQADLLDPDAVAGLVPAAVAAIGPLAILINNASIFEHDTLETATPESWHRHMGSNLYAPLFLSQAFAAQISTGARDDRNERIASGVIVNMVDQRVRSLTPEFMTYTLAKYGLWGLTQTTAQALGPDIRVNAIGPGPTLPGERQSVEHFVAQRAATILERGPNLPDICAALRFILASQSLTGQLLCIDGGQHLAWETKDKLGTE